MVARVFKVVARVLIDGCLFMALSVQHVWLKAHV